MDIDADGDLDVLSGSYTGEVYFFEAHEQGLRQGVALRDHAGALVSGGVSITPEALDMDADGDLDLVIGTRTSGVFWIENQGTPQQPIWASKKQPVQTRAGEQIQGSNAHHADWDGDGRLDLVLGSEWGGVIWHRNLSPAGAPQYGEAAPLVPRREWTKVVEGSLPAGPGSRTKVHVTDFNGDGRVDLLVGDFQSAIETLPPLTGKELAAKQELEPEYEKRRAAYDAQMEVRNQAVRAGKEMTEEQSQAYDSAREAYLELSRKMSVFDREVYHSHGYVWLYLRKLGSTAPQAPQE